MIEEEKLNEQEKAVYDALKKVIDPELKVDLVDLGLIYGIEVKDKVAFIKMTLTIMGCPLTDMLHDDITAKVTAVDGINDCKIDLVWYPQWTPDKMSRVARLTLGVHL